MLITLQVLIIIFILSFIGLATASFVILNKIFAQIKYRNYLMEKLTHNIYLLSKEDKKEN